MKEHDDDLEVGGSATPVAPDATEIAEAITIGLERIATVLERGLRDLASAMTSIRDVAEKPVARHS